MQDVGADQVIQRWDLSADVYASKCTKYGDINREVLLTPIIMEMLGDIKDQEILDAGCGEGFLSRLLAERGSQVTAVDYSKRFLEIARDRSATFPNIDFIHANLENLDVLSAHTFEFIVSCLVLQNVPDYQSALKEMYRVLRPGGACILAITHPCFSSDASWVRDANGKKLHWKIDNYFYERGYEIQIVSDSKNNPINFHRTLTSYHQAILAAEFTIKQLLEPCPTMTAIEKYPDIVDDLRMSHFLVFYLSKLLA